MKNSKIILVLSGALVSASIYPVNCANMIKQFIAQHATIKRLAHIGTAGYFAYSIAPNIKELYAAHNDTYTYPQQQPHSSLFNYCHNLMDQCGIQKENRKVIQLQRWSSNYPATIITKKADCDDINIQDVDKPEEKITDPKLLSIMGTIKHEVGHLKHKDPLLKGVLNPLYDTMGASAFLYSICTPVSLKLIPRLCLAGSVALLLPPFLKTVHSRYMESKADQFAIYNTTHPNLLHAMAALHTERHDSDIEDIQRPEYCIENYTHIFPNKTKIFLFRNWCSYLQNQFKNQTFDQDFTSWVNKHPAYVRISSAFFDHKHPAPVDRARAYAIATENLKNK